MCEVHRNPGRRAAAQSFVLVGLAVVVFVLDDVAVAQDPPHRPARQFRITTAATTTTSTAAPTTTGGFGGVTGLRCDLEEPCAWTWNSGFSLASAANFSDPSSGSADRSKGGTSLPTMDSGRNLTGHFLFYAVRGDGVRPSSSPGNVSSPWFTQAARQRCTLAFDMHASAMADGAVAVLLTNPNHTWEVRKVPGNSLSQWQTVQVPLGRQEPPFMVTIEVLPGKSAPSHLALDDIRLDSCVHQPRRIGTCLKTQFRCANSTCIDRQEVCDIRVNCADGEDERQGCDQVPRGARCSYEEHDGEIDPSDPTICGWRNKVRSGNGDWHRMAAENATIKYAPLRDHTTQSPKGHYACATGRAFGHAAVLESPEFPKLPYYHMNHTSAYFNSCHVRFHHYADRMLRPYGLTLYAVERDPRHASGLRHELWTASIKDDVSWVRVVRALPGLTHPFTLQLVAQSTLRRSGCLAVDDLTLGPECFGIGVPENETREYPTSNDSAILEAPIPEKIYEGNITKSYGFSSCGVRGRLGPTPADCAASYANSSTRVAVLTKKQQAGVQVWTVPDSGLYTVFVRGARGGLGLSRACNTSGALVRATFYWDHGDRIHIIAGQRGTDACEDPNPRIQDNCSKTSKRSALESIHVISRGGGGGGGGASAIFKVDQRTGEYVPLVVAAGGGGHSAAAAASAGAAYAGVAGRGFQDNQAPGNGLSAPEGKGPGGGGGWNDSAAAESSATDEPTAGRPLTDGAAGGAVCAEAALWNTAGGFGGGGGGCAGGGGGGGWKGGDAAVTDTAQRSGHGGTSFVHPSRVEAAFLPTSCHYTSPLVSALPDSDEAGAKARPEKGFGDAMVVIVAAVDARCPCKHFCLARTLAPATFKCACPLGYRLARDGFNCHASSANAMGNGDYKLPTHHLVVIILCVLVTVAVILFFVVGFPRCPGSRKKLPSSLSPEPLGGNNPEVQLSRLRQATGMVTEFNPNYEFGGSTCTLQDLTDIPRESLTLVKALGQGAFGEVYQGFLLPTNVPPTSPTGTSEGQVPPSPVSEVPVAVKTLPELSSPESEKDFVTEACIMSKFNHPNIVRFIGVCFEKMPRFIVLELLPGGDLKSFLRESRPKPNIPPSLTMTDLLKLAIDVAKGCQYLEDRHFIHRDMAARNCLLTTKGPGRVVKIADFGMARDIYRADYYRKGGKAMLPVKWMPPEAFLDGMFTSKTDVWSFGVLLWEVMSMGYMPYPGRGNQEVMQLVTSGGRLEPPANCPGPVYHVMTQCWHATPEERPSFGTILERLGYCIQDPDVVAAPLPVFHRPPSMERDATVMRPPNADNVCLQVYRSERSEVQSPGSEDYLIPMPSSNYSLSTERTELQSASSSLDSMDKLLGGAGGGGNHPSVGGGGHTAPEKHASWETSFTTTPPDELPIRAPLQQPYSNVALNC